MTCGIREIAIEAVRLVPVARGIPQTRLGDCQVCMVHAESNTCCNLGEGGLVLMCPRLDAFKGLYFGVKVRCGLYIFRSFDRRYPLLA